MSTKNKWFAMSQKTDAEGVKSSEAEISIYDNIGGWGITANEFLAELKGIGDVDKINLRIVSGGGSIVDGNTIFNALKRHKASITVHIDSLAASMASVIAMAGDKIHMAENALLMIHNPWTMSIGGADQLRKDADLLDKMSKNIRGSYARSNLDTDALIAAMDAETYYTASEALEAGFIDEIEGANLAAASIGDMETLKNFASIPQGKIDEIKITCQAKQIEALDAKAIELANDLNIEREAVATEKAINAQAAIDLKALCETHVTALAKAHEVTQKAISAKAAELIAESGTPALKGVLEDDTTPSANKMTREDADIGYKALVANRDFQGAQEFFAEHYNLLT